MTDLGVPVRGKLRFGVLLALAVSACSTPTSSVKEAEELLRGNDAEIESALKSGDLERIVSFYADDAILLPAAEPQIRGKAAIRDEWAHVLAIPGFRNETTLTGVEVAVGADMAYTTGTYVARMADEDGGEAVEPGKWVTIWKKQPDDTWRIVVDIYNTDIPPPDHQ